MMARRTESTYTETAVKHVSKPEGAARENGPHLIDLRAFVAACDGLPDDLRVHMDIGTLDGGGRRDVTFSVSERKKASEQ